MWSTWIGKWVFYQLRQGANRAYKWTRPREGHRALTDRAQCYAMCPAGYAEIKFVSKNYNLNVSRLG